jgi:CheY-like chemotaxis protein
LPWATVDLASDGLEAAEKARTGTYDLLLMDCQITEMDGFEATGAIRSLDMPSVEYTDRGRHHRQCLF